MLFSPNVRVERRLEASAAGCKVSARTRGWAPACLRRFDLSTTAPSPSRLIAALCQRSSLQTTPAFRDRGEACLRSMTDELCRRDLWALQYANQSNTGRLLHAARCTPAPVMPLGRSPTFAQASAQATHRRPSALAPHAEPLPNNYLSTAGAQRST
jgi:hypothetical protein